MILPRQTIKFLCQEAKLIDPWVERTEVVHETFNGPITLTGGLSPAGYDIHVNEDVTLSNFPSGNTDFELASSLERFKMPDNLLGQVCDKSTWARQGLFVQNTIIEPGWEGYLTLELTFNGAGIMVLKPGTPIAQIIFMRLEMPTNYPYNGKYQNQLSGPQSAR